MGYYRSGKAIYFNNHESNDSPDIIIADADNEEKADFILNRILGHSSNFIPLAIRTCSPDFHGDKVALAQFKGRMNGAIDALNKLDQVKKTLFYGRDNNLITEGQGDVAELPTLVDSNAALAIDVIHAILGIATEAGELLEALRNAYNGNGLDWVNLKEEYGDLAWYEALLAKSGDYTFEEVWATIVKKLTARYPDKFASELAIERNLEAERAILEDAHNPLNIEHTHEDKLGVPAFNPEIENEGEASMQDEGDLHMRPTPPVSGSEAVKDAEAKADTAFAQVAKIEADAVEQPSGGNSELAKPVGYRSKRFPDEHIANQPVRREDLE